MKQNMSTGGMVVGQEVGNSKSNFRGLTLLSRQLSQNMSTECFPLRK